MSLRSPLGRVLGHGPAKEGAHHWWVQRLTSLALIPLSVWLVIALFSLPAYDYATVHAWVSQSGTALLLVLFIALTGWHSKLGVQVIVEDYVHGSAKTLLLILSTFAHTLVAAAAIFAVLKVAFANV